MNPIQIGTFQELCSTTEEVRVLHAIMVEVYAVTEVDIWGHDYQRMDLAEFTEIINKEELLVAKFNGQLVGCLHLYRLTDFVFSFGLLSVDFNFKGKGIGRELIQFAEEIARKNKGESMEIEVLRAKHQELEFKQILDQWYQRLGYELIQTVDFLERKPDKVEKSKLFVQPSVFDCYRKIL